MCTYLCFKLYCLIVGESFFPVYPAERCALNGKVKVMLLKMCSKLMSVQSSRRHSEKDVSGIDIIKAVLSWDLHVCLRGLSGW